MPSGIWSTTSRTSSANSLGSPYSRVCAPRQYTGRDGSTSCTQASTPPRRLRTPERPASDSSRAASADRTRTCRAPPPVCRRAASPGPRRAELLEVDGAGARDRDHGALARVADIHQLEGLLAAVPGVEEVRQLARRDLAERPSAGRSSGGRGVARRDAAERLVVDELVDGGVVAAQRAGRVLPDPQRVPGLAEGVVDEDAADQRITLSHNELDRLGYLDRADGRTQHPEHATRGTRRHRVWRWRLGEDAAVAGAMSGEPHADLPSKR